MIVLGIDPAALATLSLAPVNVTPGAGRVVRSWVVRTEKRSRKLAVRASGDNVRRARHLAQELEVALACEAQSWPRNAGASAKVALASGVVCGLAELHGLPLVQASPQDVKRAVCGVKTASKDDVIGAIERRFPDVEWPKPNSVIEHTADAVASVVACLDAEARRLAERSA